MSKPKAIHLGTVTCGDEGPDIIIADEGHERRELVLRQQGLDLRMFLAAVTALYLIQRASAYKILNDILTYALGFRRNDAHALALIEGSCEIVNRQTVDPCTDDTEPCGNH